MEFIAGVLIGLFIMYYSKTKEYEYDRHKKIIKDVIQINNALDGLKEDISKLDEDINKLTAELSDIKLKIEELYGG